MPTPRPTTLALGFVAALVTATAVAQPRAVRIEAVGRAASQGWVVADGRLLVRDTQQGRWRDRTPFAPGAARPDAITASPDGVFWVVALSRDDGAARYDIYRSANGGADWARSTLVSTFAGVASVSISVDQDGTAWLLGRRESSSNFADGELWRSTDAGTTWNMRPAPPSAGRIVAAPSALFIVGGPSGAQLYVADRRGDDWRLAADASQEIAAGQVALAEPVATETGWRLVASVRDDARATLESWSAQGTERPARRALREQTVEPGARVRRGLTGGTGPAGTAVRHVLQQLAAAGVREAIDVPLDGDITAAAVAVVSPTEAWIWQRDGVCVAPKQQCAETSTLWATADGGETFVDITPPPAAEPALVNTPRDVALSENRGFDKCTVASVAHLQTWWNESPYRDVNAYIGGISRGCSQPLLTPAWVRDVFAQGWRVIPTWVGYQAPCTSCTSCRNRFSLDIAEAEAEGVREADRASDAASALSFPPPTIVYFDLEAYASNDMSCRAAVSAFVGGWSRRMRERGHVAGVYGSATNASQDWTAIAQRPDAVWIGKWDLRETVWGLTPLSDAEWNAHQRIHQYRGGHDETWGGVTFNIDNDIEDGPVAAPAGVALPDTSGPDLVIESPLPDAVLTDGRVRVRGIASDADRGDSGIASVAVNGVVASGDRAAGREVASWSADVDLPLGTTTIDVDAVDDSAQRNATRRSVRVTIASTPGTPTPPPTPSPPPTTGLPMMATVLVSDLTDPQDAWLDATHAYWIDRAGRLGRARLDVDSQAAILDASLLSPTALSGDDESVYVADARGLWRYRKSALSDAASAGGEWFIATDERVSALVATGPWLVYAGRDTGRIVRVELSTNTALSLATSSEPRALQVAGERLVWVEGARDGAVRTIRIDGTDDHRIAVVSNALSLWASDARVVWTELVDSDGSGRVMAVEADGADVHPVIEGLRRPAAVVQVTDAIFVAESEADGTVWRTKLDGTAAERVVERAAEPMRIVATDRVVAWLERVSGEPGAGRLVAIATATRAEAVRRGVTR